MLLLQDVARTFQVQQVAFASDQFDCLFFLIVLLIINLYIIVDYKDNFDEYLEYQDKTFQNSISEIFHTYEEFSNFIFETEVNTDDVKQLMYEAEQADEDERNTGCTLGYSQTDRLSRAKLPTRNLSG